MLKNNVELLKSSGTIQWNQYEDFINGINNDKNDETLQKYLIHLETGNMYNE